MQVKHWITRHSNVADSELIANIAVEDVEVVREICEDESEDIVNKKNIDWLKEWTRNTLQGRINKIAKRK